MNFIIYNKSGRILRRVGCPQWMGKHQAHEGEFVLEGTASSITQKIVDGKVVDKTPEEIEADRLPGTPEELMPAQITNEQWQEVLNRLKKK